MANHTHKSGGGNGMKVDIDITDYTEEITAGIKAAIKRALIRIGLDAETYAKKVVRVVTGRLRNSITHYVKGNSVFIGSNVEYARYVEEGTSRAKPHPYLRPAVTNNMDKWKQIITVGGLPRRNA
jgi:HK97 gp10 family phage protein